MSSLFEAAVTQVGKSIPDFEIRYKDESWSSKVIAALVWLFNRNYMKSYTTTRYPRVYFPSRKYVEENPKRAVKILAHEFVHLWDRKQKGVWFSFSYALPQLLALILLVVPVMLSFFCSWWVAALAALPVFLFALPIPAYWRMRWECRGYTMNAAMNFWRYGSITDSTIEWVVEEFTGWAYYKMWPFKKSMTRRYKKAVEEIKTGDLDRPFQTMKQFVEEYESGF